MATLTERFYFLVAPDIPNEWDVEEILEPYLNKSDAFCNEIFNYIQAIWPISNSLCFDFLQVAPDTLNVLEPSQLPQWVCEILDRYEKDGLRATQRFMRDVGKNFSGNRHTAGLISLCEVEGRLLPFIRGVAGRDLLLSNCLQTYTDTKTIFVPSELGFFSSREENILLYKLILAFQWGYIRCSSFTLSLKYQENAAKTPSAQLWLTPFFDSFAQPLLAKDLYFFLETIRVAHFLSRELPGLMRGWRHLPWPLIPIAKDSTSQASQLIELQNHFLHHSIDQLPLPSQLNAYLNKLTGDGVSGTDTLSAVSGWYQLWSEGCEEYEGINPLVFQGEFRPQAIEAVRQEQFQQMSEDLIDSLAAHLVSLPRKELTRLLESEKEKQDGSSGVESDITMIMDPEFARTADSHSAPLLITINNEGVDLPEEVLDSAQKFYDEFGHIPGRFISSAIGKAGNSTLLAIETECATTEEQHTAAICYDEWDYRRRGFRKNWCSVNIKELAETRSGFISKTLPKYHGLMIRLRHQFEMIRTTDRFARRQRDGDDIDLDALVESLADTRAGLPPSDHLFIRLLRDERDISVIFLVDMSNSTVGWVGTTIKESLVLMTEALDVLGDRYGIYGFSGMKRTRCELFHIKHLHEPYGEKVRERIGAIAPREYTRMGPAIRHCTKLLAQSDSRLRLLITLTDGKPEDYDDYKGEYAIEDTRHALLEAKTAGVHPFCITIDHHAHDYMDHMYGAVNYIFVNDIRKLPIRIPEIYRTLTT